MKSLNKLLIILSLVLLSACGTTMHADREPEPEMYDDADDFYNSLWTEMEYTDEQAKLISFGRQFLGTPYVWGGTNPKTGFDCSGFTQFVYKKALGINLPRMARDMAKAGKPVPNMKDLEAGDLVLFNLLGYNYSHVGIYIGNGRFFHASTSKRAIVIGNIRDEYFTKRYNGARRILR